MFLTLILCYSHCVLDNYFYLLFMCTFCTILYYIRNDVPEVADGAADGHTSLNKPTAWLSMVVYPLQNVRSCTVELETGPLSLTLRGIANDGRI